MNTYLNLKSAMALANCLLDEAEAVNACVSVSVVDISGQLLVFLRDSKAPWSSIEISNQKAVTSVSFRLPTSSVAKAMESESERVQKLLLNRADLMALGGGEPIFIKDTLIGAVGVSGATEELDVHIACQGLSKFQKDIFSDRF